MERLTKHVGCGEAILVSNINFCRPYIKAGACKTGVKIHSDGRYGYQRHCNDECVLGMAVDRLAAYEDCNHTHEELADALKQLEQYKATELSPDICANYKTFEDELIGKGITFSRVLEIVADESAGLLVSLPCKVGDTVYWGSCFKSGINHGKVEAVKISRFGFDLDILTDYMMIKREFEKVFLTKSAAQDALKGDCK